MKTQHGVTYTPLKARTPKKDSGAVRKSERVFLGDGRATPAFGSSSDLSPRIAKDDAS
ncbi:hypothetical protein MICABA_00161 [Microbacterium sp. T2.11-28]|nr:hypothetical protein MICABA_00161 [Microbacterium sp. T2.11-28]